MPQALLALVGWSLFAFAGAYRWTLVPILVAAAALTLAARPRLLEGAHRTVDALLCLCLAVVALQQVPVPAAVRDALSPSAGVVDQQLTLAPAAGAAWRPLSLDPAATAWAFGTALASVLVFWVARDTFGRGGVRQACLGIAWCGLALAAIVFVQRAVSPHHIYGFWAPVTRTARPTPFGPFVNRNDLAAWLLLAAPLVLGYAMARFAWRADGRRLPAALESALDARAFVLGGSVFLMVAALVASLSRSGLAGIATGLCVLGLLGRRRLSTAGAGSLAVAMAALLLLALPYTNLAALGMRLGDTLPADMAGRLVIWRETWPMARDFLGVGVGVGAYERGMLVYQQSPRLQYFNHAHDEYLQVLAEGGLLLAGLVGATLAAGAASALARLRRDGSPVFWIRAGAVSGLAAVAAQSIWDTGLRMPANAVLCAVVAALALHDDRSRAATRAGRGGSRPGPPAGDRTAADR